MTSSEPRAKEAISIATHWFEPIADHLGRAYLRYSFTKGTEQEVGFLVETFGLQAGSRVLDIGCGPGRHAHALAAKGIDVVGLDISERFVDIARQDAPPGARFVRADARHIPVLDGTFDLAISLCQGAFGLLGGIDEDVALLRGASRALRPGGSVAITAFSALFVARHMQDADFDPETGLNHELTEVRDEDGIAKTVDLWTTCSTPRELVLLASAAGLRPENVWSTAPGDYAKRRVDLEQPELLMVARRP